MPSVCIESVTDVESTDRELKVTDHPKVVIMGAAGVGKTAIVNQFLYDRFPVKHVPTVEEMHKSVYNIAGTTLSLDLLDTSGSYQFPAMRKLAIKTSDAFVLVYAIDSNESFQHVSYLKDMIKEFRPPHKCTPIVVVGNKCDLEESREVQKAVTESIVSIDWEDAFVEASAKDNVNIVQIFKAVLAQAHICYALEPAVDKRRKSLPSEPTCPQIRGALQHKRHSCILQ